MSDISKLPNPQELAKLYYPALVKEFSKNYTIRLVYLQSVLIKQLQGIIRTFNVRFKVLDEYSTLSLMSYIPGFVFQMLNKDIDNQELSRYIEKAYPVEHSKFNLVRIKQFRKKDENFVGTIAVHCMYESFSTQFNVVPEGVLRIGLISNKPYLWGYMPMDGIFKEMGHPEVRGNRVQIFSSINRLKPKLTLEWTEWVSALLRGLYEVYEIEPSSKTMEYYENFLEILRERGYADDFEARVNQLYNNIVKRVGII